MRLAYWRDRINGVFARDASPVEPAAPAAVQAPAPAAPRQLGDIDLQPCGGTHVKSTGEIGPLKLGKIEKKGAINRRVSVVFG